MHSAEWCGMRFLSSHETWLFRCRPAVDVFENMTMAHKAVVIPHAMLPPTRQTIVAPCRLSLLLRKQLTSSVRVQSELIVRVEYVFCARAPAPFCVNHVHSNHCRLSEQHRDKMVRSHRWMCGRQRYALTIRPVCRHRHCTVLTDTRISYLLAIVAMGRRSIAANRVEKFISVYVCYIYCRIDFQPENILRGQWPMGERNNLDSYVHLHLSPSSIHSSGHSCVHQYV